MKLLPLYLFTMLLLFPFWGEAQQRDCAAMDNLEIKMQEDPSLQERMDAIEQHTRNFMSQGNYRAGEIVTIPIVFHVVYRNSSQNLSDAQLLSQLQVLNDDFRRLNADANNQWPQAADTQIEFCLASVDPDGNATSGIQRRQTNKRSFSYNNDGVKFNSSGGLDAWPAGDYLNFWVCNLGNGLLGYAQFPGGDPATDGVVCDYLYVGSGGSAQAPFDLGRTATHEVGHWLNLRHIWGDGGCSVDDFISDTPTSDAPNYGCANGHVSCGSTDMVENYMDYSDDACMNLFTSGQVARMQTLFSAGGARASLANSNGCGNGTGGPTCSDGVQNGQETGVDCGGPDCSPCSTAGCDTPGGTVATNIKPKRARLNWDAVSSANDYTVEIRAVGGTWQSSNTGGTNTTVSSLSNGTTYEWRVAANCTGTTSDFSAICSFTAGNSGSGACGSTRIITKDALHLFPNPAQDQLFVNLGIDIEEEFTLSIHDLNGRLIERRVEAPTNRLELNLTEVADGMYFLRIDLADGSSHIHRFVVNR